MIVCVCHSVSDRDIVAEVQGGCTSFEDLQGTTRVATCCGCCEDCARQVMAAAQVVAQAKAHAGTRPEVQPVQWHPALTA